jgi:hypothetical protein
MMASPGDSLRAATSVDGFAIAPASNAVGDKRSAFVIRPRHREGREITDRIREKSWMAGKLGRMSVRGILPDD